MTAGIDHPTEKILRRFTRGLTSRAENRAVVAHLLRRCDRCARIVRAALGPFDRRASGRRT